MYTTIIHPIRKSLHLSLEAYVLLDAIYHLSHNDKYGGWCVASKEYLGEVCDLKRSRVFEILKELEEKELLTRDANTGFMKTNDVWNEMIANKNDWLIAFNGKESQFVSAKIVQEKLNPPKPYNPENGRTVQKADGDSPESGRYIYIDNNITTNVVASQAPQSHIFPIEILQLVKRVVFENKEQKRAFFKRNVRAGKDLAGFSKEQILKAMVKCQLESKEVKYDWTLETVSKKIFEYKDKTLKGEALQIYNHYLTLLQDAGI